LAFLFVGRKQKKEDLCEREKRAYLSAIVVFIFSTLDALYALYSFSSYSSIIHLLFIEAAPALFHRPLYCLDGIYLFSDFFPYLMQRGRVYLWPLIYVDIVWIIAARDMYMYKHRATKRSTPGG